MNDNVKPIVLELIETKAKLDPLNAKFDNAKERIREVGPDTYTIPGVGKVIVSAPVERKVKGSELVIDHEALEKGRPGAEGQAVCARHRQDRDRLHQSLQIEGRGEAGGTTAVGRAGLSTMY